MKITTLDLKGGRIHFSNQTIINDTSPETLTLFRRIFEIIKSWFVVFRCLGINLHCLLPIFQSIICHEGKIASNYSRAREKKPLLCSNTFTDHSSFSVLLSGRKKTSVKCVKTPPFFRADIKFRLILQFPPSILMTGRVLTLLFNHSCFSQHQNNFNGHFHAFPNRSGLNTGNDDGWAKLKP